MKWQNLKLFFRGLVKNPSFSLITMSGLSLSLVCVLLIALWIRDEKQKDIFHESIADIYSVYRTTVANQERSGSFEQPAGLALALKDQIPEVQHATAFLKNLSVSQQGENMENFSVQDRVFKFAGSRANPDFFNIFSFPLLYGDKNTALAPPNAITISQKMAIALFGSAEEAMNQTIRHEQHTGLLVTGVFQNIPSNSSMDFDYLMNMEAFVEASPVATNWTYFGMHAYIQLEKGSNAEVVGKKIKRFLDKYIDQNESHRFELGLQPYKDSYLLGAFEDGRPAEGRMLYVRIFSWFASFILIIAILNYINLITAYAGRRNKEVGVRKVVGASKTQLAFQFYIESILFTLLAGVSALGIATLVMPYFNILTGKQLSIPYHEPIFWLSLVSTFIIIGIISGIYPSLVLTSLTINKYFKQKIKRYSLTTRRALVMVQFVISFLFILAFIVVYQQVKHVTTQLGFDRDNLIYIPIEGTLTTDYVSFKEEALKIAGVTGMDRSSQIPHTMDFNKPVVFWEGKEPESVIPFTMSSVGYDFVNVMDLKVVKGRDFDKSYGTDENNFLINQIAAKEIGEDAMGKTLSIWGKVGQVVGIVEDYHFTSAFKSMTPLILDIKEQLHFGTILVKLESHAFADAIASIANLYSTFNPGFTFDYSFAEDDFIGMYATESLMLKITLILGIIVVIISCMGLFGLMSFITEKRKKEIGIRKVLGASTASILQLLSIDYLKLIFLATIVSIPIGWIAYTKWLENFAYHIDLNFKILASAVIILVASAMTSILSKAWASTLTNPVNVLKDE